MGFVRLKELLLKPHFLYARIIATELSHPRKCHIFNMAFDPYNRYNEVTTKPEIR